MSQCPKCNINSFHNNECLRCGYIDKVQKEKRLKNKIEENNLSSTTIGKEIPKPKINYNLENCKDCEKLISKNAEKCPHCGVRLKPHIIWVLVKWYLILSAIVFIIVAIWTCSTPY